MNDKGKVLKKISRICVLMQILLLLVFLLSGLILLLSGETRLGRVLIVAGVVSFAGFAVLELYIEKEAYDYVCPECGHRYKADMDAVMTGWHGKGTHTMRCPECGKKAPNMMVLCDSVESTGSVLPGRYLHFKGNEYEVLFCARNSETEEEMVVYRALYGDKGIWVRPASMWNETVERDGESCPRFVRLGD